MRSAVGGLQHRAVDHRLGARGRRNIDRDPRLRSPWCGCAPLLDAFGQSVVGALLGDEAVEEAEPASGGHGLHLCVVRAEDTTDRRGPWPSRRSGSTSRSPSSACGDGVTGDRVGVGGCGEVGETYITAALEQCGDDRVDGGRRPYLHGPRCVDVVAHDERAVELHQPLGDLGRLGDDVSAGRVREVAVGQVVAERRDALAAVRRPGDRLAMSMRRCQVAIPGRSSATTCAPHASSAAYGPISAAAPITTTVCPRRSSHSALLVDQAERRHRRWFGGAVVGPAVEQRESASPRTGRSSSYSTRPASLTGPLPSIRDAVEVVRTWDADGLQDRPLGSLPPEAHRGVQCGESVGGDQAGV